LGASQQRAATVLDHGGEVRLQNREDGGLRVTVVLSNWDRSNSV
jgi:hypothetical protein